MSFSDPFLKRGPVGASVLAKIVNDDASSLDERRTLGVFASKLAPAVGRARLRACSGCRTCAGDGR
ncbi:hypothetical protein C1Y26_05810 [Pseudomonas sp. MPR-R2A7]|nr:hypothetical protein C1Y23_06345 [Pseudomonas sp. GW460-12]PMX36392.1 hypothetical protein C1Y24_06300 [Pseudomonas sp. MPR-R2A4]PMX42633.1 hypothetical protein C1Y26_05810 [Pseudomonas sp. MPR-R2A7]PMX54603.1 hypothetical protein C1Y17_07330 [Pseudomonas sp. MPR-R2A6]PMX92028.1 hypothetical protein C1Y21_08465 [Pseudomonas sp. MPR-R2A3]PMY15095.1 hypothetical protein C1Y22_06455 [Pseudomonas sp. MPR-R2A5]PNA35816.1 hypothetical protein C1Y16_06305 [Pseudomonas sp. MPR-ANB1]PNA48418.1 hyp